MIRFLPLLLYVGLLMLILPKILVILVIQIVEDHLLVLTKIIVVLLEVRWDRRIAKVKQSEQLFQVGQMLSRYLL